MNSRASFSSIGQEIMRKTDTITTISNRRLFSNGAGVADNVGKSNYLNEPSLGTDAWKRAKEKQERMQAFARTLKVHS